MEVTARVWLQVAGCIRFMFGGCKGGAMHEDDGCMCGGIVDDNWCM